MNDQYELFEDYTQATNWERLVSSFENGIRTWTNEGTQSLIQNAINSQDSYDASIEDNILIIQQRITPKLSRGHQQDTYILRYHLPLLSDVFQQSSKQFAGSATSPSCLSVTNYPPAASSTLTSTLSTTPNATTRSGISTATGFFRSRLGVGNADQSPGSPDSSGRGGTRSAFTSPDSHGNNSTKQNSTTEYARNAIMNTGRLGMSVLLNRRGSEPIQVKKAQSSDLSGRESGGLQLQDTKVNGESKAQSDSVGQGKVGFSVGSTSASAGAMDALMNSRKHATDGNLQEQEQKGDGSTSSMKSTRKLLSKQSKGGLTDVSIDNYEQIMWPHSGTCQTVRYNDDLTRPQRMFGLDYYMLLVPDTYNQRFMSEEDAKYVRSALCIALVNVGCMLPVLLPLHDSYRACMWGVAYQPDVGSMLHFRCDSLSSNKLPPHLSNVKGQLDTFGSQLAALDAQAGIVCRTTRLELDGSLREDQLSSSDLYIKSLYDIDVSCCASYRFPEIFDKKFHGTQTMSSSTLFEIDQYDWDSSAPWRPWASYILPTPSMYLDLIWYNVPVRSVSSAMTAKQAQEWRVCAVEQQEWYSAGQTASLGGRSIGHSTNFMSRPPGKRRNLRIDRLAINSGEFDIGGRSFSHQLQQLINNRSVAQCAKTMNELGRESWWHGRGIVLNELGTKQHKDRVQTAIQDIFYRKKDNGLSNEEVSSDTSGASHSMLGEVFSCSKLNNGAPIGCLLSRLALHMLNISSLYTFSQIWCVFIRELRYKYWETGKYLPRMPLMDANIRGLVSNDGGLDQGSVWKDADNSAAAGIRLSSSSGETMHSTEEVHSNNQQSDIVNNSRFNDQESIVMQTPNQQIWYAEEADDKLQKQLKQVESDVKLLERLSVIQPTGSKQNSRKAALQGRRRSCPQGPILNQFKRLDSIGGDGQFWDVSSYLPSPDGDASTSKAGEEPSKLSRQLSRSMSAGPQRPRKSGSFSRNNGDGNNSANSRVSFKKNLSGRVKRRSAFGETGSIAKTIVHVNDKETELQDREQQHLSPFKPQLTIVPPNDNTDRGHSGEVKGTESKQKHNLWESQLQEAREKLSMLRVSKRQIDNMIRPPYPDHNYCLLQQYLQMLNVCIAKVRVQRSSRLEQFIIKKDGSASASNSHYSSPKVPYGDLNKKQSIQAGNEDYAEGVLRPMTDKYQLQQPSVQLNVPITQDPPIMPQDVGMGGIVTQYGEDMRSLVLCSDMAAFKAANPGCVLDDFIKWYSPKDHHHKTQVGKSLSKRYSNAVQQYEPHWDNVRPVPASRQVPLFDPLAEGERVLHVLETLSPIFVCDQLICCAITGAVDMLSECHAAQLPVVDDTLQRYTNFVSQLLDRVAENSIDSQQTPSIVTIRSSQAQSQSLSSLNKTAETSRINEDPNSDLIQDIVQEMQYVEAIVATGECLRLRIPTAHNLVDQLLSRCIDPAVSSWDYQQNKYECKRVADAGSSSSSIKDLPLPGSCINVTQKEDRDKISFAIKGGNPAMRATGSITPTLHSPNRTNRNSSTLHSVHGTRTNSISSLPDAGLSRKRVTGTNTPWPLPVRREWTLLCCKQADQWQQAQQVPHRFYVSEYHGKLRIATVMQSGSL